MRRQSGRIRVFPPLRYDLPLRCGVDDVDGGRGVGKNGEPARQRFGNIGQAEGF